METAFDLKRKKDFESLDKYIKDKRWDIVSSYLGAYPEWIDDVMDKLTAFGIKEIKLYIPAYKNGIFCRDYRDEIDYE